MSVLIRIVIPSAFGHSPWFWNFLIKISNHRSSKRRCSIKKLLLKTLQYLHENICVEFSWSLLRVGNFIKKRFQHKPFPVNIAKFLRTPILKNFRERLLLKSCESRIHGSIEKISSKQSDWFLNQYPSFHVRNSSFINYFFAWVFTASNSLTYTKFIHAVFSKKKIKETYVLVYFFQKMV